MDVLILKCKVCGTESGKFPLCWSCNQKKEQGLIVKCPNCNSWHYRNQPCLQTSEYTGDKYLYEPRKNLLSHTEQQFWEALQKAVPPGYRIFPQINLATFIQRTDDSRYRNELFRNVDFLITDAYYAPKIVVEINDQSHLTSDRRERDEKVKNILEEAGIPLIKLWTSYGVNLEYIQTKVSDTLNTPIVRKHHYTAQTTVAQTSTTYYEPVTVSTENINTPKTSTPKTSKKKGCYIATAVYGSYDCPQVWTLRRYRDTILADTWYGRAFIWVYYMISPVLVRWFGASVKFSAFWRPKLNKLVNHLNQTGISSTPYQDRTI